MVLVLPVRRGTQGLLPLLRAEAAVVRLSRPQVESRLQPPQPMAFAPAGAAVFPGLQGTITIRVSVDTLELASVSEVQEFAVDGRKPGARRWRGS